MTQNLNGNDLPQESVIREDYVNLLLESLGDPHSYNPFTNGFYWMGFLWGLPIPLAFLWFHRRLEPAEVTELLSREPIHFLFMLHPVVFGFVFGLAGSVVKHYVDRLREESVRDYLTGLYNHRFFRKELKKRISESDRYGGQFCFVLLDLDHFKMINDHYGHQRGDEVLEEFAELLEDSIRQSDTVFRYGGEEFALLLPDTDREDGYELADRVREEVAKHDFGIDRQVTVSGGVVEYPLDSREEKTLVQIVDERLYSDKESGRNTIVAENSPEYRAVAT